MVGLIAAHKADEDIILRFTGLAGQPFAFDLTDEIFAAHFFKFDGFVVYHFKSL